MANNSRGPRTPAETRRLADALRINLLKRKAAKAPAKPAKKKEAEGGD
jgi:hypothetical protein